MIAGLSHITFITSGMGRFAALMVDAPCAQPTRFDNHDNHLFELHTGTLDQRLARYALGKEAAA